MSSLEALFRRLCSGDTAALARAISLAETSSELADGLNQMSAQAPGRVAVVGVTGPPGVGKSTLVSALVTVLRQREKRVAVVAVDPSSPITGGSVLGDRTRMGVHSEDPDVFIRSVSARGHLGGLSADTLCIIDLIDAAGWDIILLETVGAGQSETEVAEVADINLVISAPGLGDDVQAIKAGILEIADVLVVNKADLPQATRTERQLRAMLQLRESGGRDVAVVKTVATENRGMSELEASMQVALVNRQGSDRAARRAQRARRMAAEQLASRLRSLVLDGADQDRVEEFLDALEGRVAG